MDLIKNIADFIVPIETDNKYIYWFKVKKTDISLNQDILFLIVYVPAENSSYCTCINDPINEIENKFLNLGSNYDNIMSGWRF